MGSVGWRARWTWTAAILLVLPLAGRASADDKDPDARAKGLYETYLSERREDTWGAFQRRLDALRALGGVAGARARDALLQVASTGRTLDDRILAAQGVARVGDVAALEELLAILAKRRHPVLTEVVGETLGRTKDGAVLAWLGGHALERSDTAMAPVLRAHAYLGLPEATEALAARFAAWAGAPATFDLAFDAVVAVGRSKHPEARPILLRAAGHADPRVRLAAADVLALQEPTDEALTNAVRTLARDPDAVVKRAMAAGIALAKSEAFLPEVTTLLQDADPRTRKAALDALKRMTGQDFGFDAGAWHRWARKEGTPESRKPHTVETYHGIEIFTERAVFILDRSGSMLWPHAPQVTCRMEVARDELVKVLGRLSAATLFNVVAFDGKVDPWKKGEAKADGPSVAKAVAWVRKQESEKGASTNTYGVLERTFGENPGFDTIYFLSDGIPEDGEVTTAEGLLAAVRDWNRFRRVQIHAIALTLEGTNPGLYPITSSMREAAAFMRDLARVGGGDFRLVARAPGH